MQNFKLLFFEQVFKCSSPSAKQKPSQSGYSFFPWKIENPQTHATAALTGNGKSLNILKYGRVLPLCPSALCWNTLISSKEIPQVKSARKKKNKNPSRCLCCCHPFFLGHKIIVFGIILMKLIFQIEFIQNEQ